jgi:hypothetical protein
MRQPVIAKVSDAVRNSFQPIVKALAPVRKALAALKDVVTVRPGYSYPDAANPLPGLVVAVIPGTTPVQAGELEKKFGVPFTVTDATVEEQLAKQPKPDGTVSFSTPEGPTASTFETLLIGTEVIEFGPPKTGTYEELEPTQLIPVKEKMDLTICVSPEAGWGELETFLAGTQERLTVAMYQFTAPHIFQAVSAAVTPEGRKFELVLHPIPERPPKSGVKANDLNEQDEVIDPLEKELKDRFEIAWATLKTNAHPEGLWASAYHIKVAVRDGDAVWLSSGNWQSSNQPNVHPFADKPDKLPAGFQHKYNRDYHAIAINDKLASIYETYIKRDFEMSATQAGQAISFAAPDLFVPEEAPEEAVPFVAPTQLFKPLRLNRIVSVQPLLTPDNYAENALKLIQSAEKNVWFQNQYINFRGTADDFPEFQMLVGALKDKLDKGLDVRIICRDMMKEESLDVLVAMGFPKEVFRFQPACHNKTIIVDGKVVMFGSHNWSNEGVRANRDASLIFDDEEIAAYLAQVYEYDWDRSATAHPTKSRPRVAAPGEKPPQGMKRVSFSAIFDD